MVSQLKVRGAPLTFAPEVFAAELSGWINFCVLPQDPLLLAILRNDLNQAIALGATGAQASLVLATFRWLHNFAPPQSFGSQHAVWQWPQLNGGARLWVA